MLILILVGVFLALFDLLDEPRLDSDVLHELLVVQQRGVDVPVGAADDAEYDDEQRTAQRGQKKALQDRAVYDRVREPSGGQVDPRHVAGHPGGGLQCRLYPVIAKHVFNDESQGETE